MKILKTLKGLVVHNAGLKALALVSAFGLWLNIASQPELATIVSVPVEYKNYPRDLEISSNAVDSIAIEARGPANRLRDMQESHVAAVIDFSSVHAAGERTFTLTGAELSMPRGVTLIRTIPAQLRLRFESPMTAKIPVEVAFSGILPAGLAVGRITIEPPKLEVTGPESRVLSARKALTDPFDLSRVTGDSEQELSVYVADAEVRFAGKPRVTVKIHFERNR